MDNPSKKGTKEKREVNRSQEYELRYLADELGVSIKEIKDAITACGSNNRSDIKKYLKSKATKR